jgi:hypothetical protein
MKNTTISLPEAMKHYVSAANLSETAAQTVNNATESFVSTVICSEPSNGIPLNVFQMKEILAPGLVKIKSSFIPSFIRAVAESLEAAAQRIEQNRLTKVDYDAAVTAEDALAICVQAFIDAWRELQLPRPALRLVFAGVTPGSNRRRR